MFHSPEVSALAFGQSPSLFTPFLSSSSSFTSSSLFFFLSFFFPPYLPASSPLTFPHSFPLLSFLPSLFSFLLSINPPIHLLLFCLSTPSSDCALVNFIYQYLVLVTVSIINSSPSSAERFLASSAAIYTNSCFHVYIWHLCQCTLILYL